VGQGFELTAHTGKRIRSADFRVSAVVLFFGYSYCTDICPLTLARLRQTMKLLGPEPSGYRYSLSLGRSATRHAGTARRLLIQVSCVISRLDRNGARTHCGRARLSYRTEPDPAHPHHIPHSGIVLVKDTNWKLRLLSRRRIVEDDRPRFASAAAPQLSTAAANSREL